MSWILSCLAVMAMITSCAETPNSAELIPDDAVAVLSIDAADLFKASALDENTKIKDEYMMLLDQSGLARKTRNFMEEIIDNPEKSGVDFTTPLMLYVGQDESGGLVGTIASASDFTTFINTMGKEAGSEFESVDQIKETELNYAKLANGVFVMFDDAKFVVYGGMEKNDDALLDDMEALFEQGAEKSVVGAEEFQKMLAMEGQVKLMVQGEVIELAKKMDRDVRRAMQMVNSMYGDIDLTDVAYLVALNITDGEVTLIGEVVPQTEAMKAFIEENAALSQEIVGTHLAYLPEDVLFMMVANTNGEAVVEKVLELMKKIGSSNNIPDEVMDMITKAAKTVDGDITFAMTDMPTDEMPAVALYASTTDNTIVKMVDEESKGAYESTGENAWRFPINSRERYYLQPGEQAAADEYVYTEYRTDEKYVYRNMTVGEVVWGYKDNVSYVAMDKQPKVMKEAKKPMSGSNIKGKKYYACFHPQALLKMGVIKEKKLDEDPEYADAKAIVELFDKVEYYNEGDTKAVLRVVMVDKSQSPIKVIYETVVPRLKKHI